ncbi:MAG: esterase-like activity of phytase family protein [Pseudomonadota bacterium]
MRIRTLLAAALALAAAGPATPSERPLRVLPYAPAAPEAAGVQLLGAVELRGGPHDFGGLSAVEVSVDGARFVALSDRGTWLDGRLDYAPGLGLRGLQALSIDYVIGKNGRPTPVWLDAEGLVIPDPALRGLRLASFERFHRLAAFSRAGAVERRLRWLEPDGAGWAPNDGVEALAQAPDGRLLALRETEAAGQGAVWLTADAGPDRAAGFAPLGAFAPTGADFGPDGRLYVVARRFTTLGGFASALWRYDLDGDDLTGGVVLAEFPPSAGFDNLEGIAAWRDDQGRIRLLAVSDDNLNLLQRTLFVDFAVTRP